jgi:8-oxo-dGTP pyrophosphatase MutT (NUDIX family)
MKSYFNHHNQTTCNNCGKIGHQFHQCRLPITSYGLIAFTSSNEGIKYLMIRRKDSFGYIDFIRGKYVLNNYEHLLSIFNEMAVQERYAILEAPSFDFLWKNMWGTMSNSFKSEEIHSKKKFDALKQGLPIGHNQEIITLQLLIDNAQTHWHETEWEFSKGRRNNQEKEIDCALREFEEETGIPQHKIQIIENVLPFEEIFIGSNHKSYKHKYFIAYIDDFDQIQLNDFQHSEVSKVEWKTFEQCQNDIRPYHLEKKNMLDKINRFLKNFRLY